MCSAARIASQIEPQAKIFLGTLWSRVAASESLSVVATGVDVRRTAKFDDISGRDAARNRVQFGADRLKMSHTST